MRYEVVYQVHVRTVNGEKITTKTLRTLVDADDAGEAREMLIGTTVQGIGERAATGKMARLGDCQGAWSGDVSVNTRHIAVVSIVIDAVNQR